jgi:hypothetical protein
VNKVVNTLLLATMFLVPTSLEAQVVASPIDFDCNAGAGKVSVWTTGIRSTGLRMTGTIQFKFLRHHVESAPGAFVYLISKSDVRNGLQLNRHFANLLRARIVSTDDPTGHVILTQPWKWDPLPFALTISNSGETNVTIRDKAASLKVNGLEPASLVLGCSTARVKFSDIVITSVNGDP